MKEKSLSKYILAVDFPKNALIDIEPGLYDPRRKLELCGDKEFVMSCGQSFSDVDPGCYQSGIMYILKQRMAEIVRIWGYYE